MPLVTSRERVGTVLAGKYRLDRIVGEGGMGTVFAAVNQATGRHVAVKLLHPDVSHVGEHQRRFIDEARAAAAIRHPNVVDVLDLDTDTDGTSFIVMEMLHGETLRAHLRARGPLSLPEAWRILQPAMLAIAAAHALGIVHRDLKPENIFLHEAGDGTKVTKVVDFGLARIATVRRTATGTQMGTPRYMAPEQARASNVGPWTDVWAMGVIWYEALTGREPFDYPRDATDAAILAHILTTRPSSVSETLGLRQQALDAIDRALSPRVEDRFANMAAFASALAESIGSAPAPPVIPETRGPVAARLPPTVPIQNAAAPPAPGPRASPSPTRDGSRGLPGWVVALGTASLIGVSIVGAFGIGCVSCLQDIGTGMAAVAAVHAQCRVGLGGSSCEFENGGDGPAERCVTVEVHHRRSHAVLRSDRVCSGELAPHGTATRPVSLGREALRTHCRVMSDCEIRVVPDL